MAEQQIQIVVAYSTNHVIGNNNELPWRIPSDLKHFKRVTMGHPIIMGRKTWESLGRALPGRPNLVISQNLDYTAQGATVFNNLEQALNSCKEYSTICIIGGAQIYTLALPLVTEIIATEVHAEVAGDAWFPNLEPDQWQETERQPQPDENGFSFDFVRYARK